LTPGVQRHRRDPRRQRSGGGTTSGGPHWERSVSNFMKLFFPSSLTVRQNKLGRWSLACFLGLV
jgi:hypothetical protein